MNEEMLTIEQLLTSGSAKSEVKVSDNYGYLFGQKIDYFYYDRNKIKYNIHLYNMYNFLHFSR